MFRIVENLFIVGERIEEAGSINCWEYRQNIVITPIAWGYQKNASHVINLTFFSS